MVGVCWISKNAEHNELLAIYVLPGEQRQGIGNKLWEQALAFFDSSKDIIVHVATYNERAINFYKKLGFVDNGRRFSDEKFKMPVSGNCIPEMEMVVKAKNIK